VSFVVADESVAALLFVLLEQAVKVIAKRAMLPIRSVFFCIMLYFGEMDRIILALSGITAIAQICLDILLLLNRIAFDGAITSMNNLKSLL
jgi:hypothetical protein